MKLLKVISTALFAIGFLMVVHSESPAAAPGPVYQGGPVANGGSIKGVVKVKGEIPKDEIKTINKNKAHCGETMTAEKYVISAAGEVQWAVAMLDGITAGKPLDTKAELLLDNKDCRFAPHVMVAPKGGTLQVKNSDPMLHNSHFYLISGKRKRNVLNLALPLQDQIIGKKKILRKTGLLSVICDAHNFMQGYIWSLSHPYGTVTDAKGSFALSDIPAGEYTLKVWHEALGEKSVPVTVESGKEAVVTIEY